MVNKLPGGVTPPDNCRNLPGYGPVKRARLGIKAAKGLVILEYSQYNRMSGASVPDHHHTFAKTVGGFASDNYWSSSQNNTNNAWKQNFNNGNQNNNNKDNNKRVRVVRGFIPALCPADYRQPALFCRDFYFAMKQLELFDPPSISLEELFEAYYTCRKNKRGTANAVAFEVDYESNLIQLWNEINSGTYEPGKSITFIVNRPVKREIFAADFRDRVVHHLIINKINHLMEGEFIYDSYSCRRGKGTHFGIRRIDTFIRRCSQNYSRDAYVLKIDLQGYFMSIDRNLLFIRLADFLRAKYFVNDRELLIELCRKTIHKDPAANCTIRGNVTDWNGLPDSKSLFHAKPGCGLPIGNLTSQVFSNFYLNPFDHFIKHTLGIDYYGRYVDDCCLVHQNRAYLASLVPKLKSFLKHRLGLTLHPKKICLQHYRHGVAFLGALILQNRIIISTRTKTNFYQTMIRQNRVAQNRKPTVSDRLHFQSSINSYLGIMAHYRTYRLRRAVLSGMDPWWQRLFKPAQDARKIIAVKKR